MDFDFYDANNFSNLTNNDINSKKEIPIQSIILPELNIERLCLISSLIYFINQFDNGIYFERIFEAFESILINFVNTRGK